MRRITSIAVVAVIILVAASAFLTYRVRAEAEAAQYSPASNKPVWLPAGTVIEAVIRSRLPASAEAGYIVTAFVSKPVTRSDKLVIPTGALLKGTLTRLTVTGSRGRAEIDFNLLSIGRQSFPIHAPRVQVAGQVQSDIDVLSTGLRMLMDTTVGAAIGAGTGDARMIDHGLLVGANASIPDDTGVPVRVKLSTDLGVERPLPD